MKSSRTRSSLDQDAIVGVSDHGGWAIFVTVARDGTLLDRRRVELVDDALPALPHHHEGQLLRPADAVALVKRVRAAAEQHAVVALDALETITPRIVGIVLRACPPLPATIEERLKDYRARNVADWVMYRKALASAAEARGWAVHWYDAKNVHDSARRALGVDDIDKYYSELRKRIGPPWNSDHRLAMSAAVAAFTSVECSAP